MKNNGVSAQESERKDGKGTSESFPCPSITDSDSRLLQGNNMHVGAEGAWP